MSENGGISPARSQGNVRKILRSRVLPSGMYRDDYRETCEEMLAATSGYAPCFLVPADHKEMTRTFLA